MISNCYLPSCLVDFHVKNTRVINLVVALSIGNYHWIVVDSIKICTGEDFFIFKKELIICA